MAFLLRLRKEFHYPPRGRLNPPADCKKSGAWLRYWKCATLRVIPPNIDTLPFIWVPRKLGRGCNPKLFIFQETEPEGRGIYSNRRMNSKHREIVSLHLWTNKNLHMYLVFVWNELVIQGEFHNKSYTRHFSRSRLQLNKLEIWNCYSSTLHQRQWCLKENYFN